MKLPMSRHRILLQTNPIWIKTGLAENAKTLLKYLHKTSKYDIAHYVTQGTPTNHALLNTTPWPSFGCIPPDQNLINQINADPNLARDASYGSVNIDNVVKDWKPTIWVGSDDIWSFSLANYADKPWFNRINSVHHITVDSVPVLNQAYEQAKRSKYFLTWAKFAAREMRRAGGTTLSHVDSIYGAMDTRAFSPITDAEKSDLRRKFGISDDTVIFLYVSRNQLRKSFPRVLEAYARFRAEHPNVRAALHFHTSFSEQTQGWDIVKRAVDYGVRREELLATYVCKTCGAWFVAPYGGEDLNCPACGVEKSLVSANIVNGVPADQMRLIYGLSDACVSAFTSGGQEYHNVQSLLCGRVLGCTNYSCGEDFCLPETRDFVTPWRWHPYDEHGTNFVKAATDVGDIASFMRSFVRQPKRALQAAGEKGRDWATRAFGIETIGAQWERLFDSMPMPDWSSIDITKPARKNDTFVSPEIGDNTEWVKTLYKEILLMEVGAQDEGLKHWQEKLQAGLPRQQIYDYFISVARQENQKNGHGSASTVDFASLLDNTSHKRALFLIKESVGDCLMCTQLFESFHEEYPNHDLYVMTSPQYVALFNGNPNVYKVLPYIPQAESELAMTGAGQEKGWFDVYLHPGILTQRQLGYLKQKEPSL